MRWIRLIGLLLLCMYAAATVHEVLPHHPGHGNGETCPLCVLLTSLAVFVVAIRLIVGQRRHASVSIPHVAPHFQSIRQPFSLRGPPSLPS